MAHEEAAFSSQHSVISENQNQHQNQRPFTAEGAQPPQQAKTGLAGGPGHAKEEKGLSGIHGKPGDEQERVQQHANVLALRLAQTYEELTRLLERNPAMKRQITEGESKEDKVYQKLKQRLKMADMAPRCQWVRQDGTSCRSPQMKQHIYCFAHRQMMEARELMLRLPPPEDANAIQVGLMRIQKSLIEDTISTKKAGLLLYSMQLALTNVGQTTFGQAKDEEMVRETVDEETALSNQQSAISQDQPLPRRHGGTEEEKRQNQNLFTAKDAEDAKDTEENQGLPLIHTDGTDRKSLLRMDAHERGLQSVGSHDQNPFTTEGTEGTEKNQGPPMIMNSDATKESEFVPVPGGYGFTRVRLRIEPGERKPAQGVAGAEEKIPPSSGGDATRAWDPTRIVKPTPFWDELECSGIPR